MEKEEGYGCYVGFFKCHLNVEADGDYDQLTKNVDSHFISIQFNK